jgi:GH15 family glucan-1,4-alpha-glucosidase
VQSLDLAVVGNCRTAALVDEHARIVWWCFPRFDGDPVFSRLLAGKEEKGFSDVVLDQLAASEAAYVRNTAIVQTILTAKDGAKVRITDFAPRFRNLGRVMRPPQLVRMIEPLAGIPRVTIRVRPTQDYGDRASAHVPGSNHIRFGVPEPVIRLTTDAPLSFIVHETEFALTRPLHLVFGPDEPFEGDLPRTANEFADRTREYWTEWVRRLFVAYDWQSEMIRAAITLKLCNYEETGGIVAALTTSIPEAPHSGRNWDYRFCWLRDAFFVVKALNRLGATRTMEDFISFILTVASGDADALKPLYAIVPSEPLDERVAERLAGFDGQGPVRIGNAAESQAQHDAYGSVILAATPMFFDNRLPTPGNEALFRVLERLAAKAADVALEPDAGLWEFRGRTRIHTHSAAMCWAGVSRAGAIATQLGLADRAEHWNGLAEAIAKTIIDRSWNAKRGIFAAAVDSDDIDASVLLLPELGLVDARDPRFRSTVDVVLKELVRGKHVMRYAAEDDFGLPETAFLVCRFWLIDALWQQGRAEEARDMFGDALRYRNRFGLLSEDVHPATGTLWGNIPQTYSMAGLILSAMRVSRSWEDRHWHASS